MLTNHRKLYAGVCSHQWISKQRRHLQSSVFFIINLVLVRNCSVLATVQNHGFCWGPAAGMDQAECGNHCTHVAPCSAASHCASGWVTRPLTQTLEQVVECAYSVPGCGKVSADVMKVVNNRTVTVEAVMDAVIEDKNLERKTQTEVLCEKAMQWCVVPTMTELSDFLCL